MVTIKGLYLRSSHWCAIDENQLPVYQLMQQNHAVFSEESGEIALSLLARGTPESSRAQLQQVQQHWQLLKMQYNAHAQLDSGKQA